ncbi:MAG: LysR family transcriptional regulator [Oscillospiraceae bacterium]|nr:LysR family transcriptional regulator [Oscillospiraceae bacterium]
MQIERLKVFIDVAECRSFTRAAERGYISQSAVSQQIAALERELGAALLLRDRKGNVSLTAEGEVFYRGCVKVVDAYEKTVMQVRNIREGDKEVIFLGMVAGSDDKWLSEVLSAFVRRCPGVRVMPTYDSFIGLRRGLESGRLDAAVAVCYDLEDIDSVVCEPLLELQSVALVSNQSPLARQEEMRAVDLKDEYLITTSEAYGPASFRHWMEERRREGYEPKLREAVDSAETLRLLVEINAGIAIVPSYMRHDKEKCSTVRLVGTEDRVPYVIAHRTVGVSEALKIFIALTKEHFAHFTEG